MLGHRGLVGSALMRALERQGHVDRVGVSSAECDLRDASAVARLYARTRPAHVLVAAARVGGILANDTQPAAFLRDNLLIAANAIHGAFESGVRKLLFLGSTCVYPRLAPQPMREEALLTGPLEPTNQWYAVAKIAGIKMCQAYRAQHGCRFICAMPTNLYGPNDNFDPGTSHVLAALIQRFCDAADEGGEPVTVWGSGTPRREFLHVDDCAEACLHLMRVYDDAEIVNVGVGQDLSVLELARLIARLTGFRGEIRLDPSKPDGTPRKLVDVSRIHALGWRARIGLEDGILDTIRWYREHRVPRPGGH